MSYELKIKNKALQEEARLIRREEGNIAKSIMWHRRHTKGFASSYRTDDKNKKHCKVSGGWSEGAKALLLKKNELSSHRRGIVRTVRRSSHLAYNFLRGTPYKRVENTCHTAPDWKEVERMIVKYGEEDERVLKQKFAEWKEVD